MRSIRRDEVQSRARFHARHAFAGRSVRARFTRASAAEDPQQAEERLASAMPILEGAIGAYLGEVIRRAHGGIWDADGDPDDMARADDARVICRSIRSRWRVRRSRSSTTDGAHLETDPAQREALEARLASLGQVDDVEYFAPSTRFDVIEIAVEALAAQARIDGTADVKFSHRRLQIALIFTGFQRPARRTRSCLELRCSPARRSRRRKMFATRRCNDRAQIGGSSTRAPGATHATGAPSSETKRSSSVELYNFKTPRASGATRCARARARPA